MSTPKFSKRGSRSASARTGQQVVGIPLPMSGSLVAEAVPGVIFVYNSEHRRDELLGFVAMCSMCHKSFESNGFIRVRDSYAAFIDCPFCGRSELLLLDPPKHFRFVAA